MYLETGRCVYGMNHHSKNSQPQKKLKSVQNENQNVVVKCIAGNSNKPWKTGPVFKVYVRS